MIVEQTENHRSRLIPGLILSTLSLLLLGGYFVFKPKLNNLLPTNSPKTYSVVRFNPKVTQKIATNDILTGKGLTNSQVLLAVTPGSFRQNIKTDKAGNWLLKLPESLKSSKYHLTVQALNINQKLAFIKSYRVSLSQAGLSLPNPGN